MTKTDFLIQYRSLLSSTYEWAADTTKLDNFITSVERTIRTLVKTWNHDSLIAKRIWKARMPRARYSLKALRSLPE